MFAIALDAVPARARRALGARFLRRARSGRSSCCGRWTSSRRAATGSSRATTTCWSTSSRTPAARSGSWSRCWSSRGAKGSGWPREPVDLHRRRPQAVDLPVPRRRRRGAAARPAATSRRCGPAGSPRRSIARSFRAVPELLDVRQRRSSRRCRSQAARPDDFTYDERDRFPVDPIAPPRTAIRAGARAGGRGRRRTRAPPPSPPRSRDPRGATTRARQQTGVPRRARRRATSRSCSARAPATASSSSALERAQHPDLRLQGTRLLRRRRDQGCRRADPLPGASRRPTCARRRSCARASSACPTRRWRARARPRRGADRSGRRPTLDVVLDDEDRRVLEHVAAGRGAWLARVDRVPPAELIEQLLARDRPTPTSCADRGGVRRGRT